MTEFQNGIRPRRRSNDYDVIVIGSGMGGSAAALKLARAGARVLVLERGKPLAKPARGSNPFIFHNHALHEDLAVLGGKSKYYGAALYRFRQSDFDATAHENGVSPAWPFAYGALEPYYAEAEQLYRVHGAAAGDPSEPPRQAPYPFPPLPHDPVIARLADRLEDKGFPVSPIPRGLDYGPKGSCTLCADCDSHLCSLDAKMDAETAALVPAIATGRVKVRSGVDCQRLLMDPSGRQVIGVEAMTSSGQATFRADHVIVAGGHGLTPLLLRRSRMAAHPEGVGNHSGWLGRGVAAHSTGQMFIILGGRRLGPRHTKTFALNGWYEVDDWPHPLGVVQVAGQTPIWDMTSRLKRPLVRAVAERSLMVFHMTEALPDKTTGWAFDGDAFGAFTPPRHQSAAFDELKRRARAAFRAAGYPVLSPRWDPGFWHETGGAIMGTDPARSVTDPEGRVHGVSNLTIADATALPSASSVNTGLTIVAQALRAAATVAKDLGGEVRPFEVVRAS